jgi:hypothetical protein
MDGGRETQQLDAAAGLSQGLRGGVVGDDGAHAPQSGFLHYPAVPEAPPAFAAPESAAAPGTVSSGGAYPAVPEPVLAPRVSISSSTRTTSGGGASPPAAADAAADAAALALEQAAGPAALKIR